MKITFIGSSHGVPEPNRKCTSILIEVGERVYFLDMGTPVIDALRNRGIPVDAVQGVFFTHMHGDHTNGLIQFVDLLTWFFKTPDPVICLPDIRAGKVIADWLEVAQNGAEKEMRYREVQPGVVYDDGVLKATAIPTQHCIKSYAYLIEAEGKTICFTGDLKNPAIDFPAAAKERPIDLLICESAHFPATDYLPVIAGCDIRKVCVTHYVYPFFDKLWQFRKEMEAAGVPVVIASDDYILNV